MTAEICFVIVQWLSSALGYLTGRLRTKWAGVYTGEVFLRDTAHGFLSWALATVVVAGLAGFGLPSLVGGGMQVASSITTTATVGAAATTGVGSLHVGWNIRALRRFGFYEERLPPDVIGAVEAMTRREDEEWEVFVRRATQIL